MSFLYETSIYIPGRLIICARCIHGHLTFLWCIRSIFCCVRLWWRLKRCVRFLWSRSTIYAGLQSRMRFRWIWAATARTRTWWMWIVLFGRWWCHVFRSCFIDCYFHAIWTWFYHIFTVIFHWRYRYGRNYLTIWPLN